MRRVAIVGCSGSGKTTLARRLAEAHGLTHIELDGIYHQAGWQPLPTDEFRQRLTERLDAAPDGWVTCGNYNSQSGGLHVERADTVVWLDLPRHVVTRRVFWRTVQRTLLRQELWNGNRERLTNLTSWDPEKSIVRWAWVHWPKYRTQYEQKVRDGVWCHARVFRLQTPREVVHFVEDATQPEGS